jgi:hypothetical protein
MENNHNKFASLINSLKDPKEYQSILEAWQLCKFQFYLNDC